MTDLEMTRLCAEAMGIKVFVDVYGQLCIDESSITDDYAEQPTYDPFHDDAQAMALVIWLSLRGVLSIGARHLLFDYSDLGRCWQDHDGTTDGIRRAIVECVAKMAAEKAGG